MSLVIWVVIGAVIGYVWSRRMRNGSMADVAAGAAGGVLGGILLMMFRLAGQSQVTVGDVAGPLVMALVGLAAWRVMIGRRV